MRPPIVRTGSPLVILLLCAALLMLPLAEPPTALAAQGNQGLQGGWAVDDYGNLEFFHSVHTQLPIMRDAGAGWVRINFRLGGCFKNWKDRGCNGRTALQTYEPLVQWAGTNNLKIVGVIANESWPGSQADWTARNAENNPRHDGLNRYIQGFVDGAVTPLVTQFYPSITTWEIWNEPNAWTGTDARGNPTGGTFIYPSNFAQLLKLSRAAARSGGRTNAIVVAGAIFSHDPGGVTVSGIRDGARRTVVKRGELRGTRLDPRSRRPDAGPTPDATTAATPVCETVPSGADYLCATYEMGTTKAGWQSGAYPLDHLGQTIYVDQGGPTSSAKLTTHLQELRSAYTRYEGSNTAKKTWVQEVGWIGTPDPGANGGVSLDVQAQNLQTAFGTFRSTSFVGRAFWFNVQDIPEAWPSLHHGLVDSDGAPKPSFTAYQTYASY